MSGVCPLKDRSHLTWAPPLVAWHSGPQGMGCGFPSQGGSLHGQDSRVMSVPVKTSIRFLHRSPHTPHTQQTVSFSLTTLPALPTRAGLLCAGHGPPGLAPEFPPQG